MTRPMIQVNDEVREMNDSEYQQWQADVDASSAAIAAAEAKAAARQSALAKLADLGLTEAEIKALLGA